MYDEGAPNEALEAASSGLVGESDLLIVGPGVLGRLVAEKWREVLHENLLVSLNQGFFSLSNWFLNISWCVSSEL